MNDQLKTTKYFLKHEFLQRLFDLLKDSGFNCIAPQVKNGNIVYAPMTDASHLPWGVRDLQSLASYQIEESSNKQAFSWSNGISSIKPFLFSSEETLWKVERNEDGKLHFNSVIKSEPTALVGVRPCDVNAMIVQDKVFLQEEYVDKRYEARRKALFIVVVNCTYASDNCFCVAMGYDTKASKGFDLAMTELNDGFIIYSASKPGEDFLEKLSLPEASQKQIEAANLSTHEAAVSQRRKLPSNLEIKTKLPNSFAEKEWDEVAERCTSCGTCTQVCPTCFCHKQMDFPSLDGKSHEHIRMWDSCFQEAHGAIHGHNFRPDTKSRYQQWLTHKFAYWQEQVSESGCVGCGRCLTWCPVKIDATDVLTKICDGSDDE